MRQLSDTSFYAIYDKDLTFINQNNVKNTIKDIIAKQECVATTIKLISTPRTSCIYFLPKGGLSVVKNLFDRYLYELVITTCR